MDEAEKRAARNARRRQRYAELRAEEDKAYAAARLKILGHMAAGLEASIKDHPDVWAMVDLQIRDQQFRDLIEAEKAKGRL